jgi:hypothetical protein
MTAHHGERKEFFVDGELFVETADLLGTIRLSDSPEVAEILTVSNFAFKADRERDPMFRYGRMFRRPNLPEYRPDAKDLVQLGFAMKETGPTLLNDSLPAGYTFLGQFIDHDLSFDATKDLSLGSREPHETKTKRSPSLDLDSLYGFDPESVKTSPLGRMVYQKDGIRLSIGSTQVDRDVKNNPQALKEFESDLPRGIDPKHPAIAAIFDSRNDENLAVAQTHVAFARFHNAVVDHLSPTVPNDKLFAEARKYVIRHYQWIILKDYLPRIIDAGTLQEVIDEGCKFFNLQAGEKAFMPVEFSVAAFRLGHSMLTQQYEWNSIFTSARPRPQPPTLGQLFTFTGADMLAQQQLLSSWLVDWTRFYDFSNFDDVAISKDGNHARLIDTSLVAPLLNLPMPGEAAYKRSLAIRNLLRGRLLGLPTGQSVAERLGVERLKPADFESEPAYALLKTCGFDRLTPLWYYILMEAKTLNGRQLGPVGSRIVAETFVCLIKASEISILPAGPGKPIWEPDDKDFSMAHLLHFVHRTDKDFLNPMR